MIEAAAKLQSLERAVAWRRRWLALQDHLALALLAVGLIAAALVVLARLQIARLHWSLEIVALVTIAGALAWHWHRRRATDKEAAFLIDQTFALEDRMTTAHEILARGGPQREVERALIADAAARVEDKQAGAVVPYRLRAWHAVALAGVAAFVVALAIPTKQLPGGEAVVEAQADIQSAGAQMEEVGEAIAKLAPAESETAKLAREQAALGRSFRMSPESRAEALRQLSALEERIRRRHDELAATHADEIVSAAEKRMRNAIAPARKDKSQDEAEQTAQAADDAAVRDENQDANPSAADKQTRATKRQPGKAKEPTPSSTAAKAGDAGSKVKAERRPPDANAAAPQTTKAAESQTTAANQTPKAESNPADNQPRAAQSNQRQPQNQPQNQPQKPVSGQPPADARADSTNPNANPQGGNPPPAQDAPPKADGQPAPDPNAQGDQAKPQANNDASNPNANRSDTNNPLANLAAEQAGKMLPQLSQELLKKAAELRDGKLSPEDIKRLQQSAEMLARDLSKIAQSKEMQQMAEQLAKQITPEQVEQFARALGNQEQLKRELQASARLMMENQQAKSMVAGMAQDLAKWGEQFDRGDRRNRQPNDGQPDQSQGNNQGNNRGGRSVLDAKDEQAGRDIGRAAGGLTEKSGGPRQPTGQGRDTRLSGNPQRGTGGEFLYLKSPAGKGASRAPYTSAYPQYRREAERSVERSQVPPRLRSVVKSYFDAINPDAAKKQ